MPRSCLLCAAAGLPSGPMRGVSVICLDHHARLRATGRRWCARCRRAVPAAGWSKCYCARCNRDRQYTVPPPPAGHIRLCDLARRLYVSERTIRSWLARGWPVTTVRISNARWVADLPSYPPPPPDPRKGVPRGTRR
jgi:hypothetical protein